MADWDIDGSTVSTTVDERITADTVELVWRSSESTAQSLLRPLDNHSGKVRREVDANGSFLAIDTANGSNTYSLTPHPSRSTLHRDGSYHVAQYQERAIDQAASVVEVRVAFLHASSRAETLADLTQSPGTSEWLFSFTTGTIATKRVSRDLRAGPQRDGVGGNQLDVILTEAQARALAEGPNRPDAVQVRQFSDGQNKAVDASPSRNVASIATPSAATSILEAGQYIVSDWELDYVNDDVYRASLTLWESA